MIGSTAAAADPPRRVLLDRALWVAAGLFGVLVLVVFVRSALHGRIGSDVGYYLPVAERMSEGLWPGRDLAMQYSFLGPAILAFSNWALGAKGTYSFYVAVNLSWLGIGSVLVARIARRLDCPPAVAVIAGLTSALQSVYFEGYTIGVEPYVAAFALAAVLQVLRAPSTPRPALSFLAAGALGCLSFWSKQYGVLVFPALALGAFQLTTRRERLVALSAIAAGALATHALVAAAALLSGGSVRALVEPLLWSKVTYASGTFLDVVRSFARYLGIMSPFLLLVPYVLATDAAARRDLRIWILLAAMAAFSVPLFARQFAHYYILIAPFGVLAGAWAVSELLRRPAPLRPVLAFAALAALLGPIHAVRIARWTHPGDREPIEARGSALMAALPKGARTVFLGDPRMMFFAKLVPPDLRTNGQMWLPFFPAATVRATIGHAELIVYESNTEALRTMDGVDLHLADLAAESGFCRMVVPDQTFVVWARDPSWCSAPRAF